MATVTGALSDFGIAPFPELQPRIQFIPSGPGVNGTRLFSGPPPTVNVGAGSGSFTIELQRTDDVRPVVWYTVRIEWLDPAGNYIGVDHPDWKLFVPAGGGELGDLLEAPLNPFIFWVDATPPPNPQPGQYWLNTTTGDLLKWS
jgi:hypothetical protein